MKEIHLYNWYVHQNYQIQLNWNLIINLIQIIKFQFNSNNFFHHLMIIKYKEIYNDKLFNSDVYLDEYHDKNNDLNTNE